MVGVIPFWLIHIIALATLVVASINDLKKREVPDLLSYSLIAIGIIIGVISTIFSNSIWPFIASIIGVILGYAIGALMFYSGQWGGGDAKILMGLGALLGFNIYQFIEQGIETLSHSWFVNVFIAILIMGVVYGTGYVIYLVINNNKKFRKYIKKKLRTQKIIRQRWALVGAVIVSLGIAFFVRDKFMSIIIIVVAGALFIGYYLFLYLKIVEKYLLTRPMKIIHITPGEWLGKDLFMKGKEQSPVKSIKQNMLLYYTGPKTAKKKTAFVNRRTKEIIRRIVFDSFATKPFSLCKRLYLVLKRKKYKEFRKKIIFALHLKTQQSFMNYCHKNNLEHLKDVLEKHHIKFKKRFISGPKDLGINENQIKLLKKLKTKTILIKQGIPFMPAFFLAYILFLVLLHYQTTPLLLIASIL